MKYYALSYLLMAFCMHAGDNPKMAPGAFTFKRKNNSFKHKNNSPDFTFKSHVPNKPPRKYTRTPKQQTFDAEGGSMTVINGIAYQGQRIQFAPEQGAIFVFKV